MNSVKENLIAARSLIDTKEKWAETKGIIIAVSMVTRSTPERASAVAALRKQGLLGGEELPIILAAFDRAIAAQPGAQQ